MAASRPAIDLRTAKERGYVQIQRDGAVSDSQWLQVRAVWSADSRRSAQEIVVPVEQFMARLESFVRRCRQIGLDARPDDGILELARRARDTRELLDANLQQANHSPGLAPSDIAGLLAHAGFVRTLRDFQETNLERLIQLFHGANFSVPGAGKTTVAYAVYAAERSRGRIARMLVIAPLSAFQAWFDDVIACFGEEAPNITRYTGGKIPRETEILIVNYQRLAANYDELADWVTDEPSLVLLDEAHRMKRGWAGEWGRACLNLAYLAERRDILTGTPAPQSPRDMVALVDYLWPNSAHRILPAAALTSTPPPDAGAMVAGVIRPLFVRTSKADLGLPPVTFMPLRVPMSPLQTEVYDALRDQYAGSLLLPQRERVDFIRMGRVVMYLLEAATNPALLTAGWLAGSDPESFEHPPLEVIPGSRLADVLREYHRHDTPAKFVELGKLLRANAEQGRKTLVWSNFVRNLKTMERMFKRYEPALIHGGVPPYATNPYELSRETEIARFRADDECMVLLANPAAMAEGISLHMECHDAIYLDRTFNAGHYLQSVDRIHRLGLPPGQETRITFLLSPGTVDDIVDDRVRIKATRLGEMLDDPNLVTVSLPDDEDYGDVVDSTEDVAALFAHLRGEPSDE